MVEQTEPLRVLITDDHPVFRFGLRALLDLGSETRVVGEAASGDQAVALAEQLQPDVVLMDLNMPGEINGIEATRRIVQANPHVAVLVLTMLEDDASVFAAMRAGARGYVLKVGEPAETLQAIRIVAPGGGIFSPAIAQHVLHFFATAARQISPTNRIEVFPELTEREREVLGLIAEGSTNTAIAERLVISPKTVRNHISSIFSKLQVADRTEAIIRAREAGMGR